MKFVRILSALFTTALLAFSSTNAHAWATEKEALALLNEAVVRLDFHFFAFQLPLGVVVTLSLLVGFLIASVAFISLVLFAVARCLLHTAPSSFSTAMAAAS